MWQLPEASDDKRHGYKYSLVYIVDGQRVIGYDNAERKGDHRHIGNKIMPYRFVSIRQLVQDFYNDVQKFKRGEI